MNKNQGEVLKKLQEDVVIPELVQKKADVAFAQIRSEAQEGIDIKKKSVSHKIPRRRIWLITAAAVAVLGAVSVGAAAYMKWSRSLSEGLQATEEQKQKLEETHMASPVGMSVEDNGITVTVEQSIVDNYYAYIAFKVEGYEVGEGMQPGFENLKVLVDGNDGVSENMEDSFAATGDFYNGLLSGDDGGVINADGSPLQLDENGNLIENYTMEDGSLEYRITLDSHGNEGCFIGKPIHVELSNLGTLEKAEYVTDVDGNWSFDWTLEGSAEKQEYSMEVPLGDSGATVLKAEISPVSIYAECEFPRQEIIETSTDDEGNENSYTTYVEPPTLTGVKMKDGTLHPYICYEPGIQGYLSDDSEIYVKSFSFDRILNVEDIEALLFVKSYPEGEEGITEDNFYVVPLK